MDYFCLNHLRKAFYAYSNHRNQQFGDCSEQQSMFGLESVDCQPQKLCPVRLQSALKCSTLQAQALAESGIKVVSLGMSSKEANRIQKSIEPIG